MMVVSHFWSEVRRDRMMHRTVPKNIYERRTEDKYRIKVILFFGQVKRP